MTKLIIGTFKWNFDLQIVEVFCHCHFYKKIHKLIVVSSEKNTKENKITGRYLGAAGSFLWGTLII